AIYIIALFGNGVIISTIKSETSLHIPMYYFLCMLTLADMGLTLCTLPSMLGIFWFNYKSIAFDSCLVQMYFIHTFSAIESGVLVAMAFDRVVAIWNPLRYGTIVTNGMVCRTGAVILTRAVCVLLDLMSYFLFVLSDLHSTTSPFNQTIHNHQTFTLTGIPGMPEKDFWMALPLCLLYSTTFLGNVIILVAIKVEQSLHEPMYYFLAMLAATDLSLSLSSMPTMLSVHLFDWYSVTLDVCITQMFFIHTFGGVESGVLVAMAFDRFVAIRFPLHYVTILTHGVVIKIGATVLLRSVSAVLPVPFLIKRLPFCHSNVLSHAYCLHQDAMRLACADTRISNFLGMFLQLYLTGTDLLFILFSYILILRTVLSIVAPKKQQKALSTCVCHI
ncbi:O51H1 protein, partial [Crocuta crocuta]